MKNEFRLVGEGGTRGRAEMEKRYLDLGRKWLYIEYIDRGVEQLEARRAHNPKVAGSSPAPATKNEAPGLVPGVFIFIGMSRKLNTS